MNIPKHTLGRVGAALALAGALLFTASPAHAIHSHSHTPPALRFYWYDGGGGDPTGTLDTIGAGCSPPNYLLDAGLVRILPNGKVAPDLATWHLSKNRLIYTFTIRRNARFSNGHHVTAKAVVFSIERALAPSSKAPSIDLFYDDLMAGADAFFHGKAHSIAGLKVINGRVLQITVTRPAAYFLASLSDCVNAVLDPAVIAGKPIGGAHDYLNNTCVANQLPGPFTLACHDKSSTPHSFYSSSARTYTLVPNRYYYGAKPRVRIELPTSGSSAYADYLAGRLEVTYLPSVYFGRWKGSTQFREWPVGDSTYLSPNVHSAPFDNVHCRLALAYAINRDALAAISRGSVRPSYAVVPPGMLGYYAGKDNPHYHPTKARAELALCPGRTTQFVFKFVAGGDNGTANMAIGHMLAAVGMNVKLDELPSDQWLNVVSQPLSRTSTQLVSGDYTQDFPDPEDFCTLFLRSGQPDAITGWHDPIYDTLVDKAAGTFNRKKRASLYRRAQHIALDQGAWISLTNPLGFVLVKPYVHGLVWTEAQPLGVQPKGGNWANVTISKR